MNKNRDFGNGIANVVGRLMPIMNTVNENSTRLELAIALNEISKELQYATKIAARHMSNE